MVSALTPLRRFFLLVTPWETSYAKVSEVPNYVNEAVPYFILFIVLESIVHWVKRGEKPDIGDSIGSLTAGLIHQLLLLISRSIELEAYIWVHEHYCLVELPWDSVWTWLLAFFCVDFGYYWAHRKAHEISLFWAAHQVHHSAEGYSMIVALRQSILQKYVSFWFYLPLALFAPPSIFYVHIQFNLLYQFWIHTRSIRSLGPLEYILNTPSHHRLHHGRNPYCIDRNFGGILIIFDRIFGTFASETEEPLAYGLVTPINTLDPIQIQLHHLKYMANVIRERPGWRNKLATIFNHPTWLPAPDKFVYPVITSTERVYNPKVPSWINAYCVVHFLLVFAFYQLMLVYRAHFTAVGLLLGCVYLLLGLTAFGNLLDPDRLVYGSVLETLRCSLFPIAAYMFAVSVAIPVLSSSVGHAGMWAMIVFFVLCAAVWPSYVYQRRHLKVV